MSSPSQANPQTQTQDRPSTPPPRAGQTTDSKLTHPAPSPSPSTHSPLPKRAKPTTALASAFDPPATATSTSTPTPTPSAPPAPAPASASASASETMSKLPLPSPPQQQLLIKLLTPSAQPPKRGSAFAAGYDIFAAAPATIPARGKALVSTGLSMAVPEGTYGRIAPRSGLAAKHHIDTGAGVIDADYRGEVKILLFNHAETDFQVELGDRVAQLIVERIYTPEVAVVEELEASVRGAGGFGSTGVGVSDGKTA